MTNSEFAVKLDVLRTKICKAYRMDETKCVEQLLAQESMPKDAVSRIQELARQLVVEP